MAPPERGKSEVGGNQINLKYSFSIKILIINAKLSLW